MIVDEFFNEQLGERCERICCPSCRCDDAHTYRRSHDRLFKGQGQYCTVRCKHCGMIYTNPRPTFEALSRHYPDDYFCYVLPETLRGLRRMVFESARYNATQQRLHSIELATGRLPPGTRVCDVGCSYGDLLHALKARWQCDVVGVDINAAMVQRCEQRGIRAVSGTLGQAAFGSASFDCITMTEYLEHEGNPKAVLEECRRVTKPGGHLAIEVPLTSSIVARVFGNCWAQLDLPRHLMFFTPETLTHMLSSVGYEVVSIRRFGGFAGASLLNLLGYEGMGRLTTRDAIVLMLANVLFLPFTPWLPEFMFVMARATVH